ncbi:hypothetical protein ALP64_204113 [Pseudomonas syringae pv. actinidiae]|nr:hypothetical protein ALP75_205094 [Pseudomonas syringae pv. actinidiae]RMS54874.1 hypothetical protein ALP64_204113 [Pseudomonas syringae pv. actinidiae]
MKIIADLLQAVFGAAQVACAVELHGQGAFQLIGMVGIEVPRTSVEFSLSEQAYAIVGDIVQALGPALEVRTLLSQVGLHLFVANEVVYTPRAESDAIQDALAVLFQRVDIVFQCFVAWFAEGEHHLRVLAVHVQSGKSHLRALVVGATS